MNPDTQPLERAFQLASSGHFLTLEELLKAMRSEGYAVDQINGPSIRKQLRKLIQDSRCRSIE